MTKIKEIRTKVYQWNGKSVPPQNNFCTNASDLLFEKSDAMGSFRFHEWLICEIETDDGIIGIGSGGNYALAAGKVLMESNISAEEVAKKAIKVAADICVFTNENVKIEKI